MLYASSYTINNLYYLPELEIEMKIFDFNLKFTYRYRYLGRYFIVSDLKWYIDF